MRVWVWASQKELQKVRHPRNGLLRRASQLVVLTLAILVLSGYISEGWYETSLSLF